jgi:hypothetical protein
VISISRTSIRSRSIRDDQAVLRMRINEIAVVRDRGKKVLIEQCSGEYNKILLHSSPGYRPSALETRLPAGLIIKNVRR